MEIERKGVKKTVTKRRREIKKIRKETSSLEGVRDKVQIEYDRRMGTWL